MANKIVRLAEHFAQMRAGARANLHHNVGAGFAMGLVMAPDDGHRAERLAVQTVDDALEILAEALK